MQQSGSLLLPLPKPHTFYVDIREQLKYCINAFYGTFNTFIVTLIFRQKVATTRLKNVFGIESFIQWDTDSFIEKNN